MGEGYYWTNEGQKKNPVSFPEKRVELVTLMYSGLPCRHRNFNGF
jgi:hypothetical protein